MDISKLVTQLAQANWTLLQLHKIYYKDSIYPS